MIISLYGVFYICDSIVAKLRTPPFENVQQVFQNNIIIIETLLRVANVDTRILAPDEMIVDYIKITDVRKKTRNSPFDSIRFNEINIFVRNIIPWRHLRGHREGKNLGICPSRK